MNLLKLSNEQINEIDKCLPSPSYFGLVKDGNGKIFLRENGKFTEITTLETIFIKIADYNYESGKAFVDEFIFCILDRNKMKEARGK